MELNKVNGDIMAVVANEDMVEGRMVVLTSHSFDNDFGSLTDLPAVKLPSTADEAKRARFVLGWAVDNRKPPYYNPHPSYAWQLRNGFGNGASNVPFTAEVWLTYPGYQSAKTIPSGTGSLAYGAGTFTVLSGQYVHSASVQTPGCALSVAYSGADAGKLQASATWDSSTVVAVVEHYDSATGALRFTTREY